MRRTTVFLLLLVFAFPVLARRRAVDKPKPYPRCSMVTGTASVTFTSDFGATLAPSSESLRPISYTYGLTVLVDEHDTLMAWNGDDLLISTDAGCSWRVEATITGWDFPPKLIAAHGRRVYAWSDNRRFLVRWDARGTRQLKPPADFIGLGVDPHNGEHLRAGGSDGTIWDSTDAGESWTQIGLLRSDPQLFYRFTFDPNDLDHIVAGTIITGAHVSRDGGQTWKQAKTGSSAVNMFELVISPADSSRVWAEGIDMEQSRRHIWVSSDGGATYQAVIDEQAGVELINGNIMAADPANEDVLFFVFGTHIFQYGTDLYRFDLRSRTLSVTHNSHDGFNAIAFSRVDPNLIYLGIQAID